MQEDVAFSFVLRFGVSSITTLVVSYVVVVVVLKSSHQGKGALIGAKEI